VTSADEFLTRWSDISALGSAVAVLGWDQKTQMPVKGQELRGHTLSVLAGLHHDHLTDPALAEAIEAAGAGKMFEVLVTDVMMPAMNGDELARRLRPNAAILLSARELAFRVCIASRMAGMLTADAAASPAWRSPGTRPEGR